MTIPSQESRRLLTQCPICQNGEIREKLRREDMTVFRCAACSFVFQNPQPSDQELATIYSSEYFIETDNHERLEDMKRATARLYYKQLCNYTPKKGGKLLEIGSGNAYFLETARDDGYEIAGIEISPDATRKINQLLGGEFVRCGTLESMDYKPGSYDICVLFDVIEHVRSPVETLRKIHDLLSVNGAVFIVTPSLDSWSAKLLGRHWMEYKQEHLSYFDRSTITAALEESSFGDIQILPNYKVLQLDYITGHFEKFRVPLLSPLFIGINSVLPNSLTRKQFRIVASGISVFARAV